MIGAGLAQRFSHWISAAIPFFLTMGLMLVSLLPWPLPFAGAARPSFVIVAVYYWVLHQPSIMPIWAIFLLGLFHDLLGFAPIGTGLLSLLTVFGVTASLRRFLVHAPLPMVMGGLLMAALAGRLCGWVMASLAFSAWQDPRPVLFLYAIDLVSYLPIAYLCARVQQAAWRLSRPG